MDSLNDLDYVKVRSIAYRSATQVLARRIAGANDAANTVKTNEMTQRLPHATPAPTETPPKCTKHPRDSKGLGGAPVWTKTPSSGS